MVGFGLFGFWVDVRLDVSVSSSRQTLVGYGGGIVILFRVIWVYCALASFVSSLVYRFLGGAVVVAFFFGGI